MLINLSSRKISMATRLDCKKVCGDAERVWIVLEIKPVAKFIKDALKKIMVRLCSRGRLCTEG